MLITDKFVIINLPKTGTTYVRKVLKEIHKNRRTWLDKIRGHEHRGLKELMLPNIRTPYQAANFNQKEQHAVCDQIPLEHSKLKIISTIRNPFERLVSGYEFRHWVSHPIIDNVELIKKDFPNYPDLNFKEYLDFHYKFGCIPFLGESGYDFYIGPQSVQFIAFYTKDFQDNFIELSNGKLQLEDIKSKMYEVEFLQNEKLNQQLEELLLKSNYTSQETKIINQTPKQNITVKQKPFMEYFDKSDLSLVLEKDKLLFDLFPYYKLND